MIGVLLFDRQTDSPLNGFQVPRAPEVGYVNDDVVQAALANAPADETVNAPARAGYVNDDVVQAALANAAYAPVGDKATASANGMCVAKGGENINHPGLVVDFVGFPTRTPRVAYV